MEMASISGFKGVYYNEKTARLEDLVAPPYDVITKQERDQLVEKEPRNIFALELPSKKECSGDVKDKYECAALLFDRWLREGVLLKDHESAIYPYDIEYENTKRRLVRKGFVCLVRADEWDKRTVLPHERTFSKVTQDRFLLRSATKGQFSQIFMIYRHNKEVEKLLKEAERKRLFSVRDKRGATHCLWRIKDQKILSILRSVFDSMKLYIADGHHRYTTAIRYRKEMEERYGLGPNAPYNYTMAYLVDARDPGLVVLPTHRLLNLPENLDQDQVKEGLRKYFHLNPIDFEGAEGIGEQAGTFEDVTASTCSQGISVMFGGSRQAFVLCPKEEAKGLLLDAVGHRELADLDVVVLEELVFKRAMGLEPEKLEAGKDIYFVPDSKRAIEELRENQVLFFMHPTRVEQVLDVADAGLCMPHKSTFFYPKILTGMVISKEEY